MSNTWNRFLKISMWVALFLFVLRCIPSWFELKNSVATGDILGCGYQLFGYAGEAIATTAVIMWVFNNWAWRWKLINTVTGRQPVLARKYQGTITYNRQGQLQNKTATLEIEQTFLTIKLKLRTDESQSNSLWASIESIHNEDQLIYCYINEPRAELQDTSSMHYGTAMLRISQPDSITGNYYSSRLTRGSMAFSISN